MLASVIATAGCGGGVPLLHGAHVLPPGDTAFGAGASAQIGVLAADPGTGRPSRVFEDLGFGAGVAPVVTGRVGIEGQNEAGLTYTGRSIRLDGRHAFDIGNDWALSLGAGGSALVPRRDVEGGPEGADDASAYGPGFDIPILFGTHAGAGIYTLWAGPRLGFQHLTGAVDGALVDPTARPGSSLPLEGTHFWAGGVMGVRVGFRHLHVALEVDAAWHHGQGTLGDERTSFDQVSIAPAGGLILTF